MAFEERRRTSPQVFQTRHFADVPALHGPALPFRPASYLADPETQDSITVRALQILISTLFSKPASSVCGIRLGQQASACTIFSLLAVRF